MRREVPALSTTLQFAGLTVLAGLLVLFLEPSTYIHLGRFPQVLLLGLLYSAPVWLGTVTIACAWSRRHSGALAAPTARAICVASFNGFLFYPAIICIGYAVPLQYGAVLVAAVNAVHVIASLSRPPWKRFSDFRLGMAAAYGLEAAFGLCLLDEPMLSAGSLAIGLAASLVLARPACLNALNYSWAARKTVASAVIALTVAAWLAFTGRYSPERIAPVHAASRPAGRQNAPASDGVDRSKTQALGLGGLTGVVLWPEVKDSTTLVAPLPVWAEMARGSIRVPVRIPFSGEYWLFRSPDIRPPASSLLRRGSPAKLSFRTIDGGPLKMEARQQLPFPAVLSCCDSIEMSVENGAPGRGLTGVELILIDSSTQDPRSGRLRSFSLGTQLVGLRGSPSEELRFAITAVAPIRQFDVIRVIFHRNLAEERQSSRVGIEAFELVPKGY